MSLRRKPHGTNPKLESVAPANVPRGADEQASGDEPMTGAQASDLKSLSAQALEPEAFAKTLTKAEASRRIDALKAKLRLMGEPPHVA
jgi:Protein of unknown function (DUF3072)